MAKATQQAKTTEQETNEIIKITGLVKRAAHGSGKYDPEEKNRISVFVEENPEIYYDMITAYDNVGAKFTPDWFKKADGYFNFSSKYDIPVMNSAGEKITFEQWLDEMTAVGSVIIIKIKQKEGAVYPLAIKVLEDGAAYDPFSDM